MDRNDYTEKFFKLKILVQSRCVDMAIAVGTGNASMFDAAEEEFKRACAKVEAAAAEWKKWKAEGRDG